MMGDSVQDKEEEDEEEEEEEELEEEEPGEPESVLQSTYGESIYEDFDS